MQDLLKIKVEAFRDHFKTLVRSKDAARSSTRQEFDGVLARAGDTIAEAIVTPSKVIGGAGEVEVLRNKIVPPRFKPAHVGSIRGDRLFPSGRSTVSPSSGTRFKS